MPYHLLESYVVSLFPNDVWTYITEVEWRQAGQTANFSA